MQPHPAAPSSAAPPLGRKRTRHFDLPPRMARKGRSYYYVCNSPRRWIPLGPDLARAKRLWAQYECSVQATTVGELVERYTLDLDCAENTRRQYRSYAKALGDAFPMPATELRAPHVALWRDQNRHRRAYVNGCLAVLKCAYGKGREWGVVDHDPSVQRFTLEARDRYLTDAEFRAIRQRAPAWLQVAMDLAYLTAARPVDVRSLRWDQVGTAVEVRQQKTGARQAFTLTPELAEVLASARKRPVVGLYVVADGKGRRISKDRLEDAFRAACEAARVAGAQFRDLRAKAATDAEAAGQDYQRLLGHTSQRMSDRYLKGRRTVKVEPVRRKL